MQQHNHEFSFKVDRHLTYNLALTDSISSYIDTVCLDSVCRATNSLSEYLFNRLISDDKNKCIAVFADEVKQCIHRDSNKSASLKKFFQRMLDKVNLDRLIFITLEYYFEHIFKPVYREVRHNCKRNGDSLNLYVTTYVYQNDKQVLIVVYKKQEVMNEIICSGTRSSYSSGRTTVWW